MHQQNEMLKACLERQDAAIKNAKKVCAEASDLIAQLKTELSDMHLEIKNMRDSIDESPREKLGSRNQSPPAGNR